MAHCDTVFVFMRPLAFGSVADSQGKKPWAGKDTYESGTACEPPPPASGLRAV